MLLTLITDIVMGNAPYTFGIHDAKHGEPCVPEQFFNSPDCIVHYTLGYVSIAGENETTRQLMSLYDSPQIQKELVPVEWEVRYLPDAAPWIQMIGDLVNGILLSGYSNPDGIMADLRANPQKTAIVGRYAEVRFAGADK